MIKLNKTKIQFFFILIFNMCEHVNPCAVAEEGVEFPGAGVQDDCEHCGQYIKCTGHQTQDI